MTQTTELTAVPERSGELRRLAGTLLATPRLFSVDEMQRRGWVVVPVPDALSDDQASALAVAAARRGVHTAFAMTTEAAVHEEQFEVPMTAEGLMAFDRQCLLRYFLLVPAGAELALLHEANYYWLLAGPAELVAEVFGRPPAESFREFFSEYADVDGWPAATRAVLNELDRYEVLL